jgi:hypothetical protein
LRNFVQGSYHIVHHTVQSTIKSKVLRSLKITHSAKPTNMEAVYQIFTLLTQYGVILCKQCQFAVVPSQIAVHLKTHHSSQTYQQRKAIQEEVQKAEGIVFEKHQVTYPDPEEPPILGLPIFEDGLVCQAQRTQGTQCRYVCRDVGTMQKHCKVEHNWENTQKRGGDSRKKTAGGNNKIWKEGQYCQRFFKFAQWKKYFQVSKQSRQDRQCGGVEISDATMERLAEEIEESMMKKRKEREIEGNSSRYLPNP